MKTIAILAQKGGTGKSTLACHLAVEAERTGPKPVAMLDLDPQASLRRWYVKRSRETPVLVDHTGGDIADTLRACRTADIGLLVIDTAPHVLQDAMAAATVADLVIVPTRAGILDIEAIDATVDIVRTVKANAAIVLNAVRPRGTLTDEARQALRIYELPPPPVWWSTGFINSPSRPPLARQLSRRDGRPSSARSPDRL